MKHSHLGSLPAYRWLWVAAIFWGLPAWGDDPQVDFERQVAPLLENNCLQCHSDTNAKGEVSLATFADLAELGYVEAGDPDASYLIDLITSHDGQPPEMPEEGEPLTAAEVAVIRAWIAAGAKWPDGVRLEEPAVTDLTWWSLQPLTGPSLPAHTGRANPVDLLIDAGLQKHDLHPVEPADAETLIRRITFDLNGLPPTPEAVAAFVSDYRRDPEPAWQRLVERLLAAEEFGEKWGQHWLDLARYAETHGYDKDKPRNHAWPYRDYVIRSLNEDKPYARFVQEQLAGDVLFPGEPDGVLGLGFLAAGPWDFIGHVEVGEGKLDGRIAKHLDRDEMIAAVFNAFMSTTVQCAQCHHHKFDPIRMEDYYRLHAVFAAVDRADRVYQGLSPDQQRAQQQLRERRATLEAEVKQLKSEQQQRLTARVGTLDERLAQLLEQFASPLPDSYGYHSQIAAQADVQKWVQVDLGQPRRLSEVRLLPAYDEYAGIGAGFGFPVRYQLHASNDPDFADDSVVLLKDATLAEQVNPKSQAVTVPGGDAAVRYLRVTATQLAERQRDYILAIGELQAIELESGLNVARNMAVTALDSIEAPPRWGQRNLTDGVFYQRLSDPTAMQEFVSLESRRAEIEQQLRSPEVDERLAALSSEIAKLSEQLQQFPVGDVVYAAASEFPPAGQFVPTGGQPREIRLLHRGDLRTPGQRMLPGAPPLWEQAAGLFAAEQAWREGQPHDELAHAELARADLARAELARYVTSQHNPLVWRSIANRVWQWTFGRPLVGTPNDFGRMGMLPTHPALLDYLATRLRDDPQHSLKSLVRLLVTSRAYRRGTAHDATNASRDADNAYLWRFNRRRLTAEEFRDSVLSVSGVLRLEPRGGPSFQDFVVEKPEHSPHYQYHLYDPHDVATHRRSIYRFVVRSQPQPMLTALDCADPSISVPMRDESTTALQALTQWNNRLVEAMAVRFAERLEMLPEAADAVERVEWACRLAWGRPPDDLERTLLVEVWTTHGPETLARVLLNTSAFTYIE